MRRTLPLTEDYKQITYRLENIAIAVDTPRVCWFRHKAASDLGIAGLAKRGDLGGRYVPATSPQWFVTITNVVPFSCTDRRDHQY